MNVRSTELPDVLIIEPKLFGDERGYFLESYNRRAFNNLVKSDVEFVQDNHSLSTRGVLRGLHYQIRHPQGKLVRVIAGEIFDVAVDLRMSSKTYGRCATQLLSADNRRMLWIPPGFAHGFFALSDRAEVFYKATDYYAPEHERCLIWNDPDLDIGWPLVDAPVISEKDRLGVTLKQAEVYP